MILIGDIELVSMIIEIEKPTKIQREIIAKLDSIVDENVSPLQKKLIIKDFTERGIIITNGTLYNNILVELVKIPEFTVFFENGLIITRK